MVRWMGVGTKPNGEPFMLFDNDQVGSGVPRYTRRPTYATLGNVVPRVVGARYNCGQCESHDVGFDGGPVATPDHPMDASYNIFDGGSKAQYAKDVATHNEDEKHKMGPTIDRKLTQTPEKVEGGSFDPDGGGIVTYSRRTELMDYTAFTAPAASVADAGSEEIEIDQALSLAGRRGRRFFGVHYSGPVSDALVSLIADTADINLRNVLALNTRTGGFGPQSPEELWFQQFDYTLNITEGSGTGPTVQTMMPPPGGDVYVAPRLFWREVNNLDATITADSWGVRIASISQRLSFQVFIELLERFADVTLL